MFRRSAILFVVSFFAAVSVPAGAQESLGDLVTEAGYAGMLGKWTAVDDQGRENHLESMPSSSTSRSASSSITASS